MAHRGSVLVLVFASVLVAETPAMQPLFQAIHKADTASVKRLLDHGASPDARDTDGTPALMAAALYGDADAVKLLLDRGANPNVANNAGATPLMWAIPDLAKVKLLVERGADVNARSANLGRTPLLIAASYPGAVGVLQLLLDKGADIHARDKSGMHALGRATTSADVAVVRFLVEHGCDPNEAGYGAARLRVYSRHHLPSIEYLMSQGLKTPPEAMTGAAHWQDPQLLARWMENGADVNARSLPYKRSALMTAAASEQSTPASLKLLLEKGADPNAEDIEGERPLDWATYRQDQARIDVLRQYGAEPGHGPRQETYPPAGEGIADPRVSLTRSVALLLPTAPAVFEKRGCVTCHSQALPGQVAAVARSKGIAVNEELARKNQQQMLAFFKTAAEAAMQGDQPAGNFITVGYVMAAFAAEHYPLDNVTAAFTHLLANQQMADGTWLGNGVSRPPMEDSIVSQTAEAVRAMTLYPIAGRKAEVDAKLRTAQRFLLSTVPGTTEERNMRLMGLVWTKAPRADVSAAVRQVTGAQRSDGGWSQRDGYEPDAWASGESLYALREAGMAVTSGVYRKGVAFLLKTQYQDGAWFVKSRAYPTQLYFESGYPFGHNQWISAGGASWASLAIAYTLPDAKAPDAKTVASAQR
jgi:ankyrin repeat protein